MWGWPGSVHDARILEFLLFLIEVNLVILTRHDATYHGVDVPL